MHISIVFGVFMHYSIKYLTNGNEDFILVVCFLFWHVYVYSLNKIYDIKEDTILNKDPISKDELNYFILISIVLVVFSIGILLFFNYSLTPYLILVSIGYLYSASPFGKNTRIKNLFIIKNIYAAFWTIAVPCIIVVYYLNYSIDEKLIHFFTYYFVLFLSIEIISDLPDIKGDKMVEVNTLAVRLGYSRTKYFSLFLIGSMMVYSIIVGKYFQIIIPFYLFAILLISDENSIKKNIGLIFYGFLVILLILSILGWAF